MFGRRRRGPIGIGLGMHHSSSHGIPFPTNGLEAFIDPTNVTLDSAQYKRVQSFTNHASQNISSTLAAPSQAQYPDTCAFPNGTGLWCPTGADLAYTGGATTDWDFLSSGGAFTVAFKVRLDTDGVGRGILTTKTGNTGMMLDLTATDQLRYTIYNTAAGIYARSTFFTGSMVADTDLLVILRWDGTTFTAELNGTQATDTPSTTGSADAAAQELDVMHVGGASDAVGYLGALLLFSRTLTDRELHGVRSALSGRLYWTEAELVADASGAQKLPLWAAFQPSGMVQSGGTLTGWTDSLGNCSETVEGTRGYNASDATHGIPSVDGFTTSGPDAIRIDAFATEIADAATSFAGVDVVGTSPGGAGTEYLVIAGSGGGAFKRIGLRTSANDFYQSNISDGTTLVQGSSTGALSGASVICGMSSNAETIATNTAVCVLAVNDGTVSEVASASDNVGGQDMTYGTIGGWYNGSYQATAWPGAVSKVFLYNGPRSRGEVAAGVYAIGAGAGL